MTSNPTDLKKSVLSQTPTNLSSAPANLRNLEIRMSYIRKTLLGEVETNGLCLRELVEAVGSLWEIVIPYDTL